MDIYIIDQCIGKKAQKRIAKRRIDFVTGNVNSYARILNGPPQLEKIKTYNQLAAKMAKYQREKDNDSEAARTHKKKADKENAAKKAAKERDLKEEHERIFPIFEAHVENGLAHVLSLKVRQKVEILRHVYNHPEAKSTLRMANANAILTELLSPHVDDDVRWRCSPDSNIACC